MRKLRDQVNNNIKSNFILLDLSNFITMMKFDSMKISANVPILSNNKLIEINPNILLKNAYARIADNIKKAYRILSQ